MPTPMPQGTALPAQGSTAWYAHYAAIHNALVPAPALAAAPTTTLLWDGTNGGTADAQGRKQVNSAQWSYDLGGGQPPDGTVAGSNTYNRWGNFEAQNYTNSLKNVYVRNGVLTIRAYKEPAQIASPVGTQVAADFSSGRIHSQGKVTIPVGAYHEARIMMPVTPGAWAAFWAMGINYTRTVDGAGRYASNWPYCGETDTAETFGQHPHKAGFALHMTNTTAPNDTTTAKPDLYVGWDNSSALYESPALDISQPNYYGLWVKPDGSEIRRYVNHRETFRYTQAQAVAAGAAWPFNQAQFLLLNLAVGGQAEGKVSGQAPGVPSFIDAGMGAAMTVEPINIWTGVTDPATLGLA